MIKMELAVCVYVCVYVAMKGNECNISWYLMPYRTEFVCMFEGLVARDMICARCFYF